jgi:hypothetical protein
MAFDSFAWTDDGQHNIDMSMNGEPFLKLNVTDEGALSHAAGQDGEQCRAESGYAGRLASKLEDVREGIADVLPIVYLETIDDAIEALRALSRGVPEDTKDAQRFRDLCELVQAGEWALCEVEITDKYGTVKENWQDGLSDIPQFCDTWASRAASWRKVRTESEQKAAIAAQRKEG